MYLKHYKLWIFFVLIAMLIIPITSSLASSSQITHDYDKYATNENKGNCVSFVLQLVPTFPSPSTTFEQKKSHINTQSASPGDVAIMSSPYYYKDNNGTKIYTGHVGYVEKVENNQITIIDSNFGSPDIRRRTGTESELRIVGYYHPNIINQLISGDHIIISFNPDQSEVEDLYLCDYETNTYLATKVTDGYKVTCFILKTDSISYDGYIYSLVDFAKDGTTQKYRPIISSVEKHEFFVSNSATVYLQDQYDKSMRFDDYLANGYHFNEPFHWWPFSFYATIQDNKITTLYEIRANDQFYSE